MNDADLYAGASWEFDRTQRNAKTDEPMFIIELPLCYHCGEPYEQEDMSTGVCEGCTR
jgi:hypothetical protein